MHIMPWEIDYAMLSFAQLKKSQNYLPEEANVEFECVLNLSNYAVDWDKSVLPKEYFIKKYNDISKNFDRIKINNRIVYSDTLYGHLDLQREVSAPHIDYYLSVCPDIYFGEYLIPYIIESTKAIPNKNFILTPQTTKRWDPSWDVLVNSNFLNIPYSRCFDLDCYKVDYVNSSPPELVPFNGFKFAGWMDCYSKEIWEKLCPVWDEWSGYGSLDTYMMFTLSLLKQKGYDVQQYILKNQVISEYWNGNEPQQNWDIDEYKEKNSEGLCGYYKEFLYINKQKEGKLDYNKLQEYAITQFNKITTQ